MLKIKKLKEENKEVPEGKELAEFTKRELSCSDLTILERTDSEEQRITTRNVMDKLFATQMTAGQKW